MMNGQRDVELLEMLLKSAHLGLAGLRRGGDARKNNVEVQCVKIGDFGDLLHWSVLKDQFKELDTALAIWWPTNFPVATPGTATEKSSWAKRRIFAMDRKAKINTFERTDGMT